MQLAIFDIDGTIVYGHSTERRFAAWLWRRGILRYRGVAAFTGFLLRYLPQYGRHTAKKNKAWLAGLPLALVEEEARRFVAEEVRQWLVPAVVTRLRDHLAAGDRVVLLSGTLDCVAVALGKQLGVSDCVGTTCCIADGVFLSKPPQRHPFGNSKRELLGELCEQFSVSHTDVVAYGDSWHDVELLDAVGTPVAVNPDDRLRRLAEDRGWEILQAGLAADAATVVPPGNQNER